MPFPLTGPFQMGRPQANLPFKVMPAYEQHLSTNAQVLYYTLKSSFCRNQAINSYAEDLTY